MVGAAQMPASAYGTQDSTDIGNYQDPLKYIALPAAGSRTLVAARPVAGEPLTGAMSPAADFLIPTAVAPEGGDPLDFVVQPRVGAAAVAGAPVMPPPADASSAQLLKPAAVPVGMASAAGPDRTLAQLPEVPPPPPSVVPVQSQPAAPTPGTPSRQEIQDLRNRLRGVEDKIGDLSHTYRASPSMAVTNPVGFGADNRTGYIGASFVSRVRYTDSEPDGALFAGVGLGDARKSVGVELSYTLASVTGDNTEFGRGGFNVKLHRRLADDLSVAAGWNGILNTGDNDFENSLYAAATKVFPLREDIKSPFSRVAVTAGLGNGQFRSEEDIANDRSAVNLFGSVAVRAAEPVSLIAEWTGQDLTLGASIVPFKNVPLVITPALRDVAGAGDGARFVLGVGYSFKF